MNLYARLFTRGRTLKRRKRAREKIRTCTGAPDFEINRIKKKSKNENEKRYKMKERIKKKQYAVETNRRKGERVKIIETTVARTRSLDVVAVCYRTSN